MADELPAFARALKRRHQSLQNETVRARPRDPPSDDSDPPQRPSKSRHPRQSLPTRGRRMAGGEDAWACPNQDHDSDDYADDIDGDDQISVVDPMDAPAPIRRANTELQRRLAELEAENRALIQEQREITAEVAELKGGVVNCTAISRQLDSRNREIDELTNRIKMKDASLASLEQSYDKLDNEYKRLFDLHSADSKAIAAKQVEINRIQREIESYRAAGRYDDEVLKSRYRPFDDTPAQPRRQIPAVPSAMKDNLPFGGDQTAAFPAVDIPVTDMSDDELRSRMQVLKEEKDEKERMLNRAPPAGAKQAHVRRQKAALEEDVERINALFSKVRQEMRRRQIY